jgi:hypothetical protein
MMMRISHYASFRLAVMVGVLWAVTVLGCADRGTPPQASAPSATIVAVEGAGTMYQTRDWNGKRVTVRVPSQAVTDIRDKDADGTVRATVTSVDTASGRVPGACGYYFGTSPKPSALSDSAGYKPFQSVFNLLLAPVGLYLSALSPFISRSPTRVAQFIRICRWLQLIHKGRLAPLENAPFSTPWA